MTRIGPGAPGSVELVTRRSMSDLLWVANTRHGPAGHWFARATGDDPDHDHLLEASDAVRYLVDHGVEVPRGTPGARTLADLAVIRDMTRGLASGNGWTPQARALLARARFSVNEHGLLGADGGGWSAFVGDLLLALVALVRQRSRLRACQNPLCRLVFLDASKSGTRRWCDDAGCGNRHRVRRYRAGHPAA